MGVVVRLVPSTVSKETVDELRALLREAERGEIVGFTYVAIHPGRKFSADAVGGAKEAPAFTLGPMQLLNRYLVDLAKDE